MRLICPRCGAEFEIEDGLIPASGREVECSSCDNIWFQAGRLRMPPPISRPAILPEAGPAQDGDAGRFGRTLPDDVLGILRDEAAHFRASRPGLSADDAAIGGQTEDAGDVIADAATSGLADEETALRPADDMNDPNHIGPDIPAPAADEASDEAGTDHAAVIAPVPIAEAISVAATISDTSSGLSAPASDQASNRTPMETESQLLFPVPEPRRAGFGRGFFIGLLIAAALFGLYVAAPHAGEGAIGDALRSLHAAGDEAHHWIQSKIAQLR